MSSASGNIRKLKGRLDSPVSYQLPIGEQAVDLNPLIGNEITLEFSGTINCIHCGREL